MARVCHFSWSGGPRCVYHYTFNTLFLGNKCLERVSDPYMMIQYGYYTWFVRVLVHEYAIGALLHVPTWNSQACNYYVADCNRELNRANVLNCDQISVFRHGRKIPLVSDTPLFCHTILNLRHFMFNYQSRRTIQHCSLLLVRFSNGFL